MTQTVPRRRHGLRTLTIVLLVIAVVLILLDRVGVYVAERVAADTIQTSQHLQKRPDVDVEGIPFLTQLATGSFDRIDVTAYDVPIGQSPNVLDLSRMTVNLDQVDVARDLSSVHAATGHATANATYAELSKTLGIDVGYSGDGRIRAAKDITLLGQTIKATITVAPRLVNGALGFGAPAINGLSGLSGDVLAALQKIFNLRVPLGGIPFGVQVQSLAVTAAGVVIQFTGRNLSYHR
jgi:hypothetical protein